MIFPDLRCRGVRALLQALPDHVREAAVLGPAAGRILGSLVYALRQAPGNCEGTSGYSQRNDGTDSR